MITKLLRSALPGVLLCATLLADTASAGLAGLMQYQSGGDILPLRAYEALVRQAVTDPATRQLVEADFVRVLTGTSTLEAKRFVCQQLAVIGGEASVPALAGLLADDEIAGNACAALAQNASPKASAALREALGKTNGRTQSQVALALGVRQDTASVAPLAKLARATDAGVAEAAVAALGRIADPAAVKALAELRRETLVALARSVADASMLVAEGLAAKGDRAAAAAVLQDYLAPAQPADLRRGALGGLLRLDADGGEQRALAVLAGTDAALKPVAIAALPAMKNPGVSKAFAAALPKLDPGEQFLLIEALAQRGDADARDAVVEQLTARYELVRHGAMSALGSIGDASSVPVLARATLTTKDPSELKAIELALASLKGGDAVDQALAAQLRNRMAGPKTPFLAALVRRASPGSSPVLLAETASADPAMAKLAFQGLSRVATVEQVPAVLKALGGLRAEAALEDAQASVGQLLRRVGTPAAHGPAVRAALEDAPGPKGQGALLPLLAICPDADGLKLVEAAASGADPATHDLGLRTLADWPDAAAWTPLAAVYARASSETDRVLALRGLTRLLGELNAKPDAQLIARYRELLSGTKGDNDRKLVLGALAGCHHPDALTLAVGQLDQAGSRAEAVLAVRQIAEGIKAQHPEAAADALKKLL